MDIQGNPLFHIENSNIEWWFVVIFSLINLNMTHVTHDTLMCRSCWVIFVSWSIQISVTEYIWQALTQQNAWRLLPLMMLRLNLTPSSAIIFYDHLIPGLGQATFPPPPSPLPPLTSRVWRQWPVYNVSSVITHWPTTTRNQQEQ